MLILIGSQALKEYGRLQNREPADYDFISSEPRERELKNGIYADFSHSSKSDEMLLTLCRNMQASDYSLTVNTPFGKAMLAPLKVLKLLKLSCVNHLDKAKHTWDLNYLHNVSIQGLEDILKIREQEVIDRVAKQKQNFFQKYKGVVHYVDHDWMHQLINPNPIYLKTLVDAVEASEEKFLRLSEEEKRMLVREECLVLSLERDLIPRIKKAQFLVKVLVKEFTRTNTSETSAMRWLSRLSIEGKVKDHPIWVTRWTASHNDYIMDGFDTWWNEKIKAMPVEFWKKVLE